VGARSAGDGPRFETDDPRKIGDGVASHTTFRFAAMGRMWYSGRMAAARDPDIDLLLRVKARDPEGLAALYARFARPIFRFLLAMTGRREAAEDALQETFLRVWRAGPAYEPVAAASTWLFTVARNAALNALAKERGRPVTWADLDQEEGPAEAAAAESAAPGAALETAERAAALRRAVDRLPPGERAVVSLAVDACLRYAEIARALEIPEGTVKSRMASAVRRLREMMRRRA
jgi:RNA polymerase sigma-70 factor (ECF subfamily)